jgi:RHS repeat-associated protein
MIDYDSFENIMNDTGTSFQIISGFAGGVYDRDTGLNVFGYRHYDPNGGRWTAKDPIVFKGGDVDLYGYSLSDPLNFVDPWGFARYRVYWSMTGVGAAGMGGAKITGIVVSMEKNCAGLYDAIEFEGYLAGVSFGLPVGVTVNNQEIFEDKYEKADVRRIRGLASLLAASAAFGDEGVSGGGYQFGELYGTNENASTAEGYDISFDYLGGRTWTKGELFWVRDPNLSQ